MGLSSEKSPYAPYLVLSLPNGGISIDARRQPPHMPLLQNEPVPPADDYECPCSPTWNEICKDAENVTGITPKKPVVRSVSPLRKLLKDDMSTKAVADSVSSKASQLSSMIRSSSTPDLAASPEPEVIYADVQKVREAILENAKKRALASN